MSPGACRVMCVQGVCLALLLAGNVAQRVTFKYLGYSLGAYPYFVLLVISGAFVPIFAAICLVIILGTGGFVEETRTWRCLGVYVVIGACNAMQGAGMVFANPYVPGYLQSLLQQAAIPFTFLISMALGARFAAPQYGGVFFILLGFYLQMSGSDGPAGGPELPDGPEGSWRWAMLFLLAQLPVACAAVLQERSFAVLPVNVFHMMFWASLSQFIMLLLVTPLGIAAAAAATHLPADSATSDAHATTLSKSGAYMGKAWRALEDKRGAGGALSGCVATMLLAQLAQAYTVKVSSAAFTVLCLALVVPLSAVAFALPAVMGPHSEHIGLDQMAALLLVVVGIAMYRIPSALPTTKPLGELDEGLLGLPSDTHGNPHSALSFESSLLMQASVADAAAPPVAAFSQFPVPQLCVSGVGLIASEYSNAQGRQCSLWEEQTLRGRSE